MAKKICSDPHIIVAALKSGNSRTVNEYLKCLMDNHRDEFLGALYKQSINLSENGKQSAWCKAIYTFYLKVLSGDYEILEIAQLKTYLIKLAIGHALNERRGEVTNTSTDSEIPDLTEEGKEEPLNAELFKFFLDKLSESCKTILTKYYYDYMNNVEIANELGLTENNVRQKKFQCINKLKEIIRQAGRNSSDFYH